MRVTQKDIAKKLNVSDSLVSRILNDKPNVWATEELRERIHETAREMGYRPNPSAQALRTGRTGLIAIWSTRLDLPFYTRYVAILQELAHADGFQTVIRPVEGSTAGWHWPADGVICIDAPSRIAQYRESAGVGALPIVNMGVLAADGVAVDEVLVDLYAGTAEAVADFARLGCRRIGYLLPAFATGDRGDGRRRAYDEAMAAMNAPQELITSDGLSASTAYQAVIAYARTHELPDGLLIFLGGEMTIGALAALHDLGARVPHDVAVVAATDSPELGFLYPAVSAIELPIQQAAAEAWRLLRNRRANPDSHIEKVVLPPRLLRRASSMR